MNYLMKIISIFLLIFMSISGDGFCQEQQWVALSDYRVVSVKDNQYHVALTFEITDQFHIQAFEVNDEFLIPTTLSFENSECIEIEEILLPTAEELNITGYDQTFLIHQDGITVNVILTSSCDNDVQDNLLVGELYYQACQGTKCFYPRVLPLEINLSNKNLTINHIAH